MLVEAALEVESQDQIESASIPHALRLLAAHNVSPHKSESTAMDAW
jgi:hypothetical protein